MKDYSVLEGLDNNFMIELRCAYDRGYRHGRDDEWAETQAKLKEEEGYKRGLEDAWACCKRFLNSDDKVCDKIFGISGWADFLDQSPSDAIEKFKEYDSKHYDLPESEEINIGDEIVHNGEKGIAMGICNNWVEVKFLKSWNCVGVHKDSIKKTGRHFEQLEEILETMKNE